MNTLFVLGKHRQHPKAKGHPMFGFARNWRKASKCSRKSRTTRTRPSRRWAGLRLETLEDRTLFNAALWLTGYPNWQEQGPGPDVLPGGFLQSGAVQSIVEAATPAGLEVYLGTANGGVWKTTNLDLNNPATFKWSPLTDQQASLSVSSMAVDYLDPTHDNTLWVGTGRVSSAGYGIAAGLLKTTNGGESWAQMAADSLGRTTINNVAATSFKDPGTGQEDIVVAAGSNIWFSNDGGNTFNVSLVGESGREADVILDTELGSTRIFAALAGVGVYESDQGGAPGTWNEMDTGQTQISQATHIKLAAWGAGPGTKLYVATANDNKNPGDTNNLTAVFQDVTPALGQNTWKTLPAIPNTGSFFYYPYFAMAVDPVNTDIVYLAGGNGGSALKGDASGQEGWTYFHTAGSEIRSLLFYGASDLLQADDQGIFGIDKANLVTGTTDPPGSPWIPLDGSGNSGNLRNTEFFRVAYDPVRGEIFGGTQDVGAPIQTAPGSQVWQALINNSSDGGWVASDPPGDHYFYDNGNLYLDRNNTLTLLPLADKFGDPYASGYNAADRKPYFDKNNNPARSDSDFSYPIAVDPVPSLNPTTFQEGAVGSQFLVGNTAVYESYDFGQTIEQVLSGMNGTVSYLAYGKNGGRYTTPAYVATNAGELYVRSTNAFQWQKLNVPSGITNILEVVVDPLDYRYAYILASSNSDPKVPFVVYQLVYQPTTGSASWTDLTFDLNQAAALNGRVDLRTLELFDPKPQQPGQGVLLVGGLGGVYRLLPYANGFHWGPYGFVTPGGMPRTVGIGIPHGLPRAVLVTDLHYDPQTDLLIAGTFGRGAWTVPLASATIPFPESLQIITDNNANTIRLVLDSNDPRLLDIYVNQALSLQIVQALVPAIDVTFGNGADQLIVDESNGFITVPAAGLLSSYISLVGGGVQDALTLDDSQDSNQNQVDIGSSVIDVSPQPGSPDYIAYSNIGSITVDSGIGQDTVNVNGPEAATTTINIGPQFTTVNVLKTGGNNSTLNIVGNVGQGDDAINLGTFGRTQGIQGTVNIENPPAYNDITIDDSGDGSPQFWTLSTQGIFWGQITNGNIGLINYAYSDTSSVTLNTGFGAVVKILATNPDNLGCQTNIVSKDDTTVFVGEGSHDVQGIASTLNLEAPSGIDTIVINDSTDGKARNVTLSTLDSNPADSEGNKSPDHWGQIIGLAPGNINYEYVDVNTLTIDGSGGGTTFNVADVPEYISLFLAGVGGTNTLNGPNQANSWTLTHKNAGTLDGNITFGPWVLGDGFQDLAGGNVSDSFNLSSVVPIAMNLLLNAPGTLTTASGTQYCSGGINNNGYLLNVAGPGTLFVNGLISGAGGLNLLPGTLTLSANNSYTGATTVNGILIVNGIQPSSAVTVNAGGVLAGVGSVGAFVAKNGGTVEPGPLGSGIGTLTAASADFSQGGTLLIRIPDKGTPGVNYDQFDVTGTLTLGGTSALVLDVNGLTKRGNFSGIVLYGSVSGKFSTVTLINNPLGFKAKPPKYRSADIAVHIT
jgi:hypothetical protein